MDNIIKDKIFGQYVLRFHRPTLLDELTLQKALLTQEREAKEGKPHRKIGVILLEDHGVFRDTSHLLEVLEDYFEFKDKVMK